jgi:hypothetical protein
MILPGSKDGLLLKSMVLGRRAARITAVAGVFVLGVASLAALVRVLPWIVAPDVHLKVAARFGRGLLAVALETALLAGPPIGWAMASAVMVERGEARALLAVGLRPWDIVRTTLVPVLLFAALAGVAALVWGTEAAAPGRLARSLVDQARRTCEETRHARVEQVPIVGVTWLCFPDAPPRLTGRLPGGGAGAFSAADLFISDDLRTLSFSDMRLLLGPTGAIRVHAARTTVAGASPLGHASNLRPVVRAILLSGTGALLALVAALRVLVRSYAHRGLALMLGASGPVMALLVLSMLERGTRGGAIYALVPASAVLGVLGLDLAIQAVAERVGRGASRADGSRGLPR